MNKILSGVLILLLFLLAGEVVNRYLCNMLPASIVGMILFFVALQLRWIKEEWVAQVAEAIISNLSLLFLAPAVGVVTIFPLIKDNLTSLGITILISTIIVLGVVGVSVELLTKLRNGANNK